jgi:hypothetical protein
MSNNPYQSPETGPTNSTNSAQPTVDILKKVQAPAIALIVYGVVSCGLALINVAYCALHMAGMNPFTQNQAKDMEQIRQQAGGEMADIFEMIEQVTSMTNGPVGLATNLIALIVAIPTIMAGSRMKNLRSHTLSLITAALACVPCTSGCCCLGLPIGIWAIIVLVNPNVKAAFRT